MKHPRYILLPAAALLCALPTMAREFTSDVEESGAATCTAAATAVADSAEWMRMVRFGRKTRLRDALPLAVERTWLFGAGRGALYDAYLSPLDYGGPCVSVEMQNERQTKWNRRVTNLVDFGLSGTYAKNPQGNGKFYDGQLNVDFGWVYNWELRFQRRRSLTLGLGGLAEFSGGGTYSTRNGNNPAQGRAAFDVAPVLKARYNFEGPRGLRLRYVPKEHKLQPGIFSNCNVDNYRTRLWSVQAQVEVPLAGVMFSPQYGQSYYELFSLGHYDHNVRPTYPGNAPSVRLHTTLSIPVSLSTDFVIGYRGEALQSRVNHLGRHSWQNGVVIGFTRNISF